MKKIKLKIKYEAIIGILLLIVISGLTVGYATFTKLFTIHGTSTFRLNGVAYISSLTVYDSSNVAEGGESHSASGLDATFDVVFDNVGSEADYHITYEVTIQNDSFYSYDFTQSTVDSDVSSSGGAVSVNYSVTGISPGETIPSGSSKTFYVTVYVAIIEGYSGDISVGGGITNEVEQEDIGSIIAAISGSSSGDLVNNSQASFTVSVANTFEYNRHFNFSLNNETDFSIVDCTTGNALADMTIAGNTTSTYQICVKANSGVTFATSPKTIGLFLDCTETGQSSAGTLSLDVPVTVVVNDDDPPIISSLTVTRVVGQTGKVTLSWSGIDDHDIDYYYILIKREGDTDNNYDPNPIKITATANPSYTISNIAEDVDYVFIVYGEDEFQNSGASATPNASSGEAVTSGTKTFSWHYSVTFQLTRINIDNGPTTAEEGKTYQANLSAPSGRDLPSSLTITMSGKSGNLSRCQTDSSSCTGYYFNANTGVLKIYNVTGNLNISGSSSSSCLIKGTKVLLANGKYKNIENVSYTDLIAVWDYKNGGITYEYPIWIEQEKKTTSYQKTTFSDNTVLNTFGPHAVYDLDKKMFVDISNKDEVNVGSKIAKIENGKIKPVTVKKIETIKRKTTYYHVVSSTYYNIIANNILTTDDATILSNLYGFTDNITWPSTRNDIINNKENLYDYKDINNSLPYYMFLGLRATEAKYLVNMGYMSDEELQYYFINNQSNPEMVKEPIIKHGSRYWPVSIDKKSYKLVKEGTKFTLPNKKVDCYYDTSSDKCYKPNDKVTIYYGTHFISK